MCHFSHQSYTTSNILCRYSSDSAIKTRSSAYKRHCITNVSKSIPFVLALRTLTKSLIKSPKKFGDKVSPCLTPKSIENQPVI